MHGYNTDWLPSLAPYNCELSTYVDRVYDDFVADLAQGGVHFLGKPVGIERDLEDGKHRRFWHLITENPEGSTGEHARNPSIHRCERLRWIAPIISEAPSSRVKVWTDASRGRGRNEVRHTAALNDCSYVVHLSERRTYMHLISAYPVESHRRREKFLANWQSNKVL